MSNEPPEDLCVGADTEYKIVRDEILFRLRMRQNIISTTLTLAGVFLAIGLKFNTVAGIYAHLAAFLALNWAQNDFRIRDLARYIRECLEPCLPSCRWESYVHNIRGLYSINSWEAVVLSHGGIFLLTQILSTLLTVIGLTESENTQSPPMLLFISALVAIDLGSMVAVAIIIQRSYGAYDHRESSRVLNDKHDSGRRRGKNAGHQVDKLGTK
ncbi:MAG: hypothetical protein N838_33130 [Thiohalocapsa sp. PB-PSB1]|nr:MAG: hypothetical protein N838_33130 [Thiohalocapsa sp. PB-PSB1]